MTVAELARVNEVLSSRRLSGKLAGYSVTPPQWGVLVALWEQDGLSLSELSGAPPES